MSAVIVTLTLSFFYWIFFKFHIWIAFIKLSFKFQYGFFLTKDNHNLVIFYRISSKFHVSIVSIKLVFKFEYKFSPTNNNQEGRQNGRHLSICFCGQSTLFIYYPITSKFHIWITFIKLWLCLITKMAAKMATTYQFTLVDTLFQSFITQFLPYMDYFHQTIVHV